VGHPASRQTAARTHLEIFSTTTNPRSRMLERDAWLIHSKALEYTKLTTAA